MENNTDIQILSDTIWSHFRHPIPSVLHGQNIYTVGQMIKKNDAELMSIRNFGKTSLRKVQEMRELVRATNTLLNTKY